MKKFTFVIIVLVYMLSSCNENDFVVEESKIYVYSVIVPDTVILGNDFDIEMEVNLSQCWQYSRVSGFTKNDSVYFDVYGTLTYDPEVYCSPNIYTAWAREKYKLSTPGYHYLYFNDSTLMDVVFVKGE